MPDMIPGTTPRGLQSVIEAIKGLAKRLTTSNSWEVHFSTNESLCHVKAIRPAATNIAAISHEASGPDYEKAAASLIHRLLDQIRKRHEEDAKAIQAAEFGLNALSIKA